MGDVVDGVELLQPVARQVPPRTARPVRKAGTLRLWWVCWEGKDTRTMALVERTTCGGPLILGATPG